MYNEFNQYFVKIRTILEINPKTICEELTDALGFDAPSYAIVRRWTKRFREGRDDIDDDPRSCRSVSMLTDENIERVQQVIEVDRHSILL